MSRPPSSMPSPAYGDGDASFRAAGGVPGIDALVERFYAWMDRLPQAREIRRMHPEDLTLSKDKLARFLSGWLGGPKRYQEVYGSIRIPAAHARFDIATAERDAWLECMRHAIDEQPWEEGFKAYLLQQLAVPAERVHDVRLRLASTRRGAAPRTVILSSMTELIEREHLGPGVHYDTVRSRSSNDGGGDGEGTGLVCRYPHSELVDVVEHIGAWPDFGDARQPGRGSPRWG